jgi:hypothetical protein
MLVGVVKLTLHDNVGYQNYEGKLIELLLVSCLLKTKIEIVDILLWIMAGTQANSGRRGQQLIFS